MRRWVPITLSLFVLAAGGCGTAPAPAAGPTGSPSAVATTARSGATTAPVTGYAAADQQYRQLRTGLNLPPGVAFPEHLPNAGDRYQPDAGIVAAQNYWLCAWLWRYVDGASAGGSQSQAAIAELVKYSRMDAYTKALDNRGRQTVDGAITAAQHGARKSVEAFTRSTCGGPFYSQSHTTR